MRYSPSLIASLSCGLFSFSLLMAGLSAQPTYNPVSAHYGSDTGYPAWTETIRWNNVIDMSAYTNGSNHFERFENARDELHAQGGGVLFYPAGTYVFDLPDVGFGPGIGPASRGLMLQERCGHPGRDALGQSSRCAVHGRHNP
ncbi:MAG: hypothetical protein JJT96_03900 [Opitutales bacterium]|nr:hypothetical protein [Opitutales bacterium]